MAKERKRRGRGDETRASGDNEETRDEERLPTLPFCGFYVFRFCWLFGFFWFLLVLMVCWLFGFLVVGFWLLLPPACFLIAPSLPLPCLLLAFSSVSDTESKGHGSKGAEDARKHGSKEQGRKGARKHGSREARER